MADKTELNLARIRACDEDIWRTIRGAKVLIDAGSGEIKGGMNGKLNGQKFKPSFGRSLKTGKKVLLPSIHTKFSHHKGSKAELLQRLKKSVGPQTKTFSRNASPTGFVKGVYSLNNAGVGTKITARHVSPLGSSTTDWEVIDKGGRRYLKNLTSKRSYVLSLANLRKYFSNASEISITGLTNQKTNANMPQKSVLETKAIKKPNYTLDRLSHVDGHGLATLAKDLGLTTQERLTGNLAEKVKAKLNSVMKKTYAGVSAARFKSTDTLQLAQEMYYDRAWDGRTKFNPLLNKTPLQQIVASQKLDKPPTVLPEKDFDEYVKKNNLPVMYRSVGHSGQNKYGFTGKDQADGFRYDDTAWIGRGIYGDGHYFAQNWGDSRTYGNYTIKAAIDPKKAKIFDQNKHYSLVPPDVLADTELLPIWCLQHGFNVIYIEGGNYGQKGYDYWSVLDRSCLIVSEEDCNENPRS